MFSLARQTIKVSLSPFDTERKSGCALSYLEYAFEGKRDFFYIPYRSSHSVIQVNQRKHTEVASTHTRPALLFLCINISTYLRGKCVQQYIIIRSHFENHNQQNRKYTCSQEQSYENRHEIDKRGKKTRRKVDQIPPSGHKIT